MRLPSEALLDVLYRVKHMGLNEGTPEIEDTTISKTGKPDFSPAWKTVYGYIPTQDTRINQESESRTRMNPKYPGDGVFLFHRCRR